ncbi:MAG: hypothetical protein Q9200_002974, partial [Gallowayella weberi]
MRIPRAQEPQKPTHHPTTGQLRLPKTPTRKTPARQKRAKAQPSVSASSADKGKDPPSPKTLSREGERGNDEEGGEKSPCTVVADEKGGFTSPETVMADCGEGGGVKDEKDSGGSGEEEEEGESSREHHGSSDGGKSVGSSVSASG